MSKPVGHLEEFTGASGAKGYKGEINMQVMRGKIALRPVEQKRSNNSPDYDLLLDVPGRGWCEYGIAWSKKPEGKKAYLSILIQPETQADVNIAAFPPDDDAAEDQRWVIVFGKPRGGKIGAEVRATLPTEAGPF